MPVVSLYQSRDFGVHVEDFGEEDAFVMEKEFETLDEEEERGLDGRTSKKQLALIYSLYLADSIVVASLQPQLYVLLKDTLLCGSATSTYWTGLVEAIFAVGSLAGLYWGWVGDRVGRRPIALFGLLGMCFSCAAMGFSTGGVSCVIIRAFGGFMASALRVMVWTMLGDVSRSKVAKTRNFSRMPLVAVGGIIGPILQATLAHRFAETSEIWNRFPILSSQLGCSSLIFAILMLNYFFLEETLPSSSEAYEAESRPLTYSDRDSFSDYPAEKVAFFGGVEEDTDETAILRRRAPVFYNDKPEPIALWEILRAPSVIVLLVTYSLFSLQSTTFDQMLPLLASSPLAKGGLALPCSFLSLAILFAGLVSAVIICTTLGASVRRLGLVKLYRICTCAFPIIYVATPLVSSLVGSSECIALLTSTMAILFKSTFANLSQTLAVLIMLNYTPDSYSLASIMGFLQASTALRGLAVGGTALASHLFELAGPSSASGNATTLINALLWGLLIVTAVGGAIATRWVKEKAVMGRDYRAEHLAWEVCYDFAEEGQRIAL